MLSFSNYDNFETQDLKNYLNDDKEHNNIAELQTKQAEYLFRKNNLGDTVNDGNDELPYIENNQTHEYTNNLSQKHANLDGTLEKLNHIIHLLEQQQDEKTETVLEELMLYLFLGFFIIYIIDSFFRAGKYYR
tara:strand:+ start:662 stop:1060 length:399 start_codon:yes stop_codon:yes gene_type:complete